MKRGFTLIEMLVVIGIIAVLIAASIGSYSGVMHLAEKSRAEDLVHQVATALTTMYQQNDGQWPVRMAMVGETGGRLDDQVAYAFVSGNTKYLTLDHSGGKLIGYDRFGVLDPWGVAILKRKGRSATLKDVASNTSDHMLWFAVDTDGNGIIEGALVGGQSVNVRATAIVWCAGRDGVISPYPYAGGGSDSKGANKGKSSGRSDDVYSWTVGQTKDVK